MLTPRIYQTEAVDAVIRALSAGQRRPAVVLPTGAGKTFVFSLLAKQSRERGLPWGRGRILVLAHRTELIEQAYEDIRQCAPELRVGIVKAERNEVLADVVVASVATLKSVRRLGALRDVSLIVIDECHHATADTYRSIVAHYDVPTVGVTATMGRADGAALGDVWQDIVYKKDIAWMIRERYLCGVRGIRVQVPDLDLRKLRKQRTGHGSDLGDAALGEAIEGSLAPKKIAEAYREHAADLQGILFAPTVHSAGVMAEALIEAGFTCELVHGAMPPAERKGALKRFREGKTQILANCMVLTEGTNLPMATVAVMARPTMSQSLYVQMAGRVLRPYPGKERAIILDVVGVTGRHSLMSPVDLFGESLKELDREEVDIDLPEVEEDPLADLDLTLGDDVALAVAEQYADGELEYVEIDLFRNSESAWQTTHGGVWFLPAGDRFIALIPGALAGSYDVLWMSKYAPGPSGWVARGMTDLAMAMRAAEDNVTAAERLTADKGRAWKAKAPSDKTLNYAARLGVRTAPYMTAGQVSALIAQAEASRRIDRVEQQRAATYGHGMVVTR